MDTEQPGVPGQMKTALPVRDAFSLLEVVIVVAIIGVLAAIAIPRLSRFTEGTTEAALKQDLRIIRSAIELFAAEHNGILPGSVTDGTNALGTAVCFRWHLWYYSNASGMISTTPQTGYPFGPYLKKFPKGRVGPGQGRIATLMVGAGVPLTGEANPVNPWKYDYTTGEFIYNWSALSLDGVTPYDAF